VQVREALPASGMVWREFDSEAMESTVRGETWLLVGQGRHTWTVVHEP
jgi:hypothetical protein